MTHTLSPFARLRRATCSLVVFCTACGQAQAEAPLPTRSAAPPPAPEVAAPPPPDPVPVKTFRIAHADVDVRSAPDPASLVRGRIHQDTPFEVLAIVEGAGCDDGWLQLPAHGYLCATGTESTDTPAQPQPELVTYDAPQPDEFTDYIATGVYDHGQPEALVPSVYAKRWRRFKGQLYADVEAWSRGDAPVGRLEGGSGNKYHFTEIVETDKGPVLLREDGQVAALDDVYLYPVSRLEGQDLLVRPAPEGMMAAFAIGYGGTNVWPTPEAPPIPEDPEEVIQPPRKLPYHSTVWVEQEPVTPDGHWFRIPDALGDGQHGYVNDTRGIRHTVPLHEPRPTGIADDELWIDVELNQQVLQLWRGDELVWFTLVSTGEAPMGTPRGIVRITDKMATKTMQSRPDAEDAYRVEDVPWTIHWTPSYAVHGAYWHWGFGRTASHGCINMAPKDVKTVWERIGPEIPDGWHTSWATEEVPGTVLQIRRKGLTTPDKRPASQVAAHRSP